MSSLPRKGPDASAAATKLGTKKRGNDGDMWEVKATAAGVHRWVKVAPVRKGPEKSAAATKLGTRARGNDGGVWEVKANAAGVQRWVKVELVAKATIAKATTARATVSKPTTPKPQMSHPGKHRLLFCEPMTQAIYADSKKSIAFNPAGFEVSDAMYRKILRGPTSSFPGTRAKPGNAYVFGPLKPLSSYKRIEYHGNDVAQTVFIDVSVPLSPAPDRDQIDNAFKVYTKSSKEMYPWDDKVLLGQVRAKYPWILFVGETYGGDVGAELWAHYTAGEIDSLIVENNYFFTA